MRCSVCKAKIEYFMPVLFGIVCPDCLRRLPKCARDNITMMTPGQIKKIHATFTEPISKPWYSFGPVFQACNDSILFSGKEVSLRNLKKIELRFHTAKTEKDTVCGWMSLLIRTNDMELEETFYPQKDGPIQRLHLQNGNVVFPETLSWVVNQTQKAIDGKTNLSSARTAYRTRKSQQSRQTGQDKWDEEYEERSRKARKEWDQEHFQSNQGKRTQNQNRQEYQWHRDQDQNSRNQNRDSQRKYGQQTKEPFRNASIDLSAALTLFDLQMPFKASELRKKRNQLLKKYHPDQGGDPEMGKKVNMAYDILCEYAEH